MPTYSHISSAPCSRLTATVAGAIETRPRMRPLRKKSVVMALDQMRLDLAHGVENHAHDNQQAGATEKLRGDGRTRSDRD